VPLYTRLRDALPDVAASVGTLSSDSSNIVQLIEDAYKKIAEKIIIVDNVNASQGLRMTYRTECKQGYVVCARSRVHAARVQWHYARDERVRRCAHR
jgi:hypothetical protein